MEKKFYIQPQTDLVRMANGQVVMAPIGGGLAGSPTAGEVGKNGAPVRKVNILYI